MNKQEFFYDSILFPYEANRHEPTLLQYTDKPRLLIFRNQRDRLKLVIITTDFFLNDRPWDILSYFLNKLQLG